MEYYLFIKKKKKTGTFTFDPTCTFYESELNIYRIINPPSVRIEYMLVKPIQIGLSPNQI